MDGPEVLQECCKNYNRDWGALGITCARGESANPIYTSTEDLGREVSAVCRMDDEGLVQKLEYCVERFDIREYCGVLWIYWGDCAEFLAAVAAE